MDDNGRPPIEPGPEPDTTDAAEPFDAGSMPDAEDEPAMLDARGDVIGES